jgi:gliding motility-associated-like protein
MLNLFLSRRHFFVAIVISLFFMLQCACANAQGENNNWAIGNRIGISFDAQPPSVFNTNIQAPFRSAAVSDSNGNLLFYTNGVNIWNKNNQIMPNGHGIVDTFIFMIPRGGDAYIVPVPGNNNQYYVFTGPVAGNWGNNFDILSDTSLRYSVVDMTLNGGLGDVLPGKKRILLESGISNAITLGGYGTCDKWIIIHKYLSDQFNAYHITSSGISNPVVSHCGKSLDTWVAMMKMSNDNAKIALRSYPYNDTDYSRILLFNFDQATGVISGAAIVDSILGAGTRNTFGELSTIEFSPDNRKLYAGFYDSSRCCLSTNIYQYDLTGVTGTALQQSKKIVGYVDSFCEMQLSADGHIYMQTGTENGRMDIIPYPDRVAPGCGITLSYATFPVNTDTAFFYYTNSLANLVPASRVIYHHDDVYVCGFPGTLKSAITGDRYIWNTGATTANIDLTQPGNYWVKTSQGCGAWRIDTFHVQNLVPPPPINDTISCNGEPVTFVLKTQGSVVWNDSINNDTFIVAQSGIYTAATMIGSCIFRDTFKVTVYPPANTALLPADTMICNDGTAIQLQPYIGLGSHIWSNGDTTKNIMVDTPGVYWISSVTPCGVFSDTVRVHFCPPEIDSVFADKDSICSGSCIQYTATVSNHPDQFYWTFEGGTPAVAAGTLAPTICYDSAGKFSARLKISNRFGADSAILSVIVLPKPQPRFRDTNIIAPYKSSLDLPACADATTVSWYDQNNNMVCGNCTVLHLVPKDWRKMYYCVMQNKDCGDTCFYKIELTDIPSLAWLPDAFTPNGDGLNDYFRLITDNPNIQLADLMICDRWGNYVYHAQQNSPGWDGTFNGKPLEMGVYFWYLRYWVLGGNNQYYTQKGNVTLIR